MRVTGFSFIRNAVKYDFPIIEAILSVLPLCDDFIVAVGQSDDGTLEMIKNINPDKIRIIETLWDESLKDGGIIYAEETNKALRAISPLSDWAFYVQGDEVIHEKYHSNIRTTMERWKDNSEIDGLLFDYVHFYGSYNYVGNSPNWYSREVRIIRPRPDIYSYRDAQGFRKGNNQKLLVKNVGAEIYHYGWVKDPRIMQDKHLHIHQYWGEEAEKYMKISDSGFDYSQIDSLSLFKGTHPAVMIERIKNKNWEFEYDISFKKLSPKNQFKLLVKQITGWNIGEYKNFELI